MQMNGMGKRLDFDPPPGIISPPNADLLNGYLPSETVTHRKAEAVALYGSYNSARIVAQRDLSTLRHQPKADGTSLHRQQLSAGQSDQAHNSGEQNTCASVWLRSDRGNGLGRISRSSRSGDRNKKAIRLSRLTHA